MPTKQLSNRRKSWFRRRPVQASHKKPKKGGPPSEHAIGGKATSRAAAEGASGSQPLSEGDEEPMVAGQSRQKKAQTPDASVQFARQSRDQAGEESAGANKQQPKGDNARPFSAALQTTGTTDDEADHSIDLAKAAIASPTERPGEDLSRRRAPLPSRRSSPKRLRNELRPECLPLKNLRSYLRKSVSAVGVVDDGPITAGPNRGGPRRAVLSFNVTPGVAVGPAQVVEVQFFPATQGFLPVVRPGDACSKISGASVANKDFGLRATAESAWPVAGAEGEPDQGGPPVEDHQQYTDYIATLKEGIGLWARPRSRKWTGQTRK